jgi:chromosome segregation ATPase
MTVSWQKYVSLQEDYYQLKEQCMEHEQTLEELGNQLSISKLQVADLREEATRNVTKGDGQWASDKEVTHCKGCNKEFNITRRRVSNLNIVRICVVAVVKTLLCV